MNDEIKKAYEKYRKIDRYTYEEKSFSRRITGNINECTAFEAGYKAGSASHDDEVSELLEAIDKMINYQASMGTSFDGWYTEIIEMGKKAKVHYIKTPCPECGGKKTIDTCVSSKVCPTCQGRGYKWEKKG